MSALKQLEAFQRIQNRIQQLQLKGKTEEAQQLSETLAKILLHKEVANNKPDNFEIKEIAQLLKETIYELKTLTEIKAKASIDYEKIEIEAVRKRLITDNLRMEQSYFNITISDTERFHTFCTNAFHQVENLLNYYYFIKFPDFKNCLKYFKNKGTKFEKDPFKISQIPAHNKLYAFEKDFYYDPEGITFSDSSLKLIRQIRNLEAHRCDVYNLEYEKHLESYQKLIETIAGFKKNGLTFHKEKKHEEIENNGKLARFIKEQDYDLVREELKILYKKVIKNL